MIRRENIKFKVFDSAKFVDFENMLNDMLNYFKEEMESCSGDSIGAKFKDGSNIYKFYMKTVDYKSAIVVVGTVEEVESYQNKIGFGTIEVNENIVLWDDEDFGITKVNENIINENINSLLGCKDEEEDDEDDDHYYNFNDYDYDDWVEEEDDYDYEKDDKRLKKLKGLVKEYKHNSSYPILPKEPDGMLFGIGFIYDWEKDDRVLLAIDQLKDYKSIIAVAEHEGTLTIYSNNSSVGIKEINVNNDCWTVYEFSIKNNKWVDLKGEKDV